MSWSRRHVLREEEFARAASAYERAVLFPEGGWNRTDAAKDLANAALKLHLFDEGYQAGKRQREPRKAARRG